MGHIQSAAHGFSVTKKGLQSPFLLSHPISISSVASSSPSSHPLSLSQASNQIYENDDKEDQNHSNDNVLARAEYLEFLRHGLLGDLSL